MRLKIFESDTTDLDDGLQEMMVSLIKQRGWKINNAHERTYNLLCISQRCDDTVKTVNSSLPEVVALPFATTKHMETKETPTFKEILQANASDLERQGVCQTVSSSPHNLRWTVILSWYDAATVDRAVQKES